MNGEFKDYPQLEALAEKTAVVDEGLPCEMLQMKDGVAACKIEVLYGRDAKPKVCREYPELQCRHESDKMRHGRGICYLLSG